MEGKGTGHGGFESGGLEIDTSRLGSHLALHGIFEDRAQKSYEGVDIGGVLQGGDGGADLNLGKLLHTVVKSNCALGFTENLENLNKGIR